MASRYLPLTLYSGLLAIGAGVWLVHGLAGVVDFPAPWVVCVCVLACLFVWQFGLPAPRVGLISMERLPQVGLLLVFSPPVAAAICAVASFLWPFLNRTYSQRSLKVAALRALHNPAMTSIMLLAAGYAYAAAGGTHPLDDLGADDVLPLAVLAITAQAVNITLMAVFIGLDGRDVRRIMTPAYVFTDLVFVPAGVLAAVLFNTASQATFMLFAGLMVILVLCFNGIGNTLAAETESGSLARLSRARRALHGARRIDDLGDRILAETRALFRFDEFYLVLVDSERQVLDVRVHERRAKRLPARPKPLSSGLFGWIVERAAPVLVDDWTRAPENLRQRGEPTEKETRSVIAVPLFHDDAVIGLLSVQHTRPGVYSNADLHLMQRLAEQVAPALADARVFENLEDYRQRLEERVVERTTELEQANQEKERLIDALRERSRKLERESQEDPLTGIANRRRFVQRLDAEIDLALAAGQPLTLAVADLDRFKYINDRLGHAVGDQVLRECAALMRRLCRKTDLVARVGGEEFALILPGMPCDAAFAFCETMRQAVESNDWRELHAELQVTLSIGLAQWDGTVGPDELLQSADAQLYRAKNAGRNQVASLAAAELG
jgi:diguanylate cyclase (GGDEF)-like protein